MHEATLAQTFGPHLAALAARSAEALGACGYSGLLVHSGSPLLVFEDDRTYPFEANAPFKVWAPLQDAPDSFVWFEPGQRPRLVLHRPPDYWYKPADVPEGYWVPHFDIRLAADRASARALLPRDLSGAAYVGDAFPELTGWGVGAINPQPLMRRLDYVRAAKTPYELQCLREASRLGAVGHRAACEAFAAGASEFEIELAFIRRLRSARAGTSLQSDHRAQLRGLGPALPGAGEAAARRAPLAADRCRVRVRRLRLRHHPHPLRPATATSRP